jgi:GntR family transcriptional regulator
VRTAPPVPKCQKIYLVLREQLHGGFFSAGMPGEIALIRQFGVARVTVRKALERLAAELARPGGVDAKVWVSKSPTAQLQ